MSETVTEWTNYLVIVFPAIMIYAAASDLLTMTISNRLCLGLVVMFLVLSWLVDFSFWSMLTHAAAGLFVLALSFVCFACGWIGGGDAKLAAGTALWFGFEQLLYYFFVAAIGGGALALLILAVRLAPRPRFTTRYTWLSRIYARDGKIPYGIVLAVAALIIYPQSELCASLLLR
jgi:prepilin peptidase CpaA